MSSSEALSLIFLHSSISISSKHWHRIFFFLDKIMDIRYKFFCIKPKDISHGKMPVNKKGTLLQAEF